MNNFILSNNINQIILVYTQANSKIGILDSLVYKSCAINHLNAVVLSVPRVNSEFALEWTHLKPTPAHHRQGAWDAARSPIQYKSAAAGYLRVHGDSDSFHQEKVPLAATFFHTLIRQLKQAFDLNEEKIPDDRQ